MTATRRKTNGKPRRDRGEIMDEMPPNAMDSERALLSGVLYLGSINSDISIPAMSFTTFGTKRYGRRSST